MKIVLVMSVPSLDATGNKNENSNNVKLREAGKTNVQTILKRVVAVSVCDVGQPCKQRQLTRREQVMVLVVREPRGKGPQCVCSCRQSTGHH